MLAVQMRRVPQGGQALAEVLERGYDSGTAVSVVDCEDPDDAERLALESADEALDLIRLLGHPGPNAA